MFEGFGNVAEMLEIEEDEHTMDLDNFSPMNELNVIVNSPKPNDNDADSWEFYCYIFRLLIKHVACKCYFHVASGNL